MSQTIFKEGDKIRMIPERLGGYLVAYQNQIKDRVAIVTHVWFYGDDLEKKRPKFKIVWQKRNGRGKEITDTLHSIRDFEIAP
jgi:hypothetical protein